MSLLAILALTGIFQINNEVALVTSQPQPFTVKNYTANSRPSLTDSPFVLQLDKLVKHGMPIKLSEAKLILGNNFHFKKAKQELDFDIYSWELSNGILLQFEDINYNENGIELDKLHFTAKNIVKHPLGVYLNRSTYTDCKKQFPQLKKAYAQGTYKFEKDKTWYFLRFNKNNVLIKIISLGWDMDMSS